MNQSSVIRGMVFKRLVEGDLTKAEKCKVVVYSCPVDAMQTETKVNSAGLDVSAVGSEGTTLIKFNISLRFILHLEV